MKPGRKNADTTPNTGDLLQVMTISLFIILLAFFILLNSIAVLNEEKVMAAIGSLLGSFGQQSGGYSVIDGTGDKDLIVVDTTHTGRIDFSDLVADNPALDQQVKILTNPRGSLVRVPTGRLFDPAGTKLLPKGRRFLDRISRIVRKNNFPIEIACHTGLKKIRATARLSGREITTFRSQAILRYLTEQKKIAMDRILAFGWGAYRPAYSNRVQETRILNDRIDFLLIHKFRKKKPKGGFIFKDFFFRSLE